MKGPSCKLLWEGDAQKMETPLSFVFEIINEGRSAMCVREPVNGCNMHLWYRSSGDDEFNATHPPGTFLMPEIKELAPAGRLRYEIDVDLDPGNYAFFCSYDSIEGDLDATWQGSLQTEMSKITIVR